MCLTSPWSIEFHTYPPECVHHLIVISAEPIDYLWRVHIHRPHWHREILWHPHHPCYIQYQWPRSSSEDQPVLITYTLPRLTSLCLTQVVHRLIWVRGTLSHTGIVIDPVVARGALGCALIIESVGRRLASARLLSWRGYIEIVCHLTCGAEIWLIRIALFTKIVALVSQLSARDFIYSLIVPAINGTHLRHTHALPVYIPYLAPHAPGPLPLIARLTPHIHAPTSTNLKQRLLHPCIVHPRLLLLSLTD